ncbi:hypothetical protein D3H55_08005 [Bacillus salacetis]|uniref:Uncharacterized protein n=1 Tax=Bacillus salacetis TaxID=2315464 RepID=A0A3A1R5U4_9BACI|nr:hypothetical protein [Bacillus salacetis]RIW35329.1 hypothetical protein D3H55_08005 [Bacillus salacetis]
MKEISSIHKCENCERLLPWVYPLSPLVDSPSFAVFNLTTGPQQVDLVEKVNDDSYRFRLFCNLCGYTNIFSYEVKN